MAGTTLQPRGNYRDEKNATSLPQRAWCALSVLFGLAAAALLLFGCVLTCDVYEATSPEFHLNVQKVGIFREDRRISYFQVFGGPVQDLDELLNLLENEGRVPTASGDPPYMEPSMCKNARSCRQECQPIHRDEDYGIPWKLSKFFAIMAFLFLSFALLRQLSIVLCVVITWSTRAARTVSWFHLVASLCGVLVLLLHANVEPICDIMLDSAHAYWSEGHVYVDAVLEVEANFSNEYDAQNFEDVKKIYEKVFANWEERLNLAECSRGTKSISHIAMASVICFLVGVVGLYLHSPHQTQQSAPERKEEEEETNQRRESPRDAGAAAKT